MMVGVVGAMAGVLFLPPVLDVASLAWRTSEGCKIWQVVDGDTVRAWCANEGATSVRLVGFDTPEFRARCASEAITAFAAAHVLRWHLWTARESATEGRGSDRYGRKLAALMLDGEPVSRTMIASGLARAYDGGRREGWCA